MKKGYFTTTDGDFVKVIMSNKNDIIEYNIQDDKKNECVLETDESKISEIILDGFKFNEIIS